MPQFETCVILCRFRDGAGGLLPIPRDPGFYRDYFFTRGTRGLADYVPDVTNGRSTVTGEVFGWFDIGHDINEQTSITGGAQRRRAYEWGLAAARANGVQVDQFPRRVVFVNGASDHGAVGIGEGMLIGHGGGALFNHTFMQHEFGHVMGLNHAWSTPPDVEYGDDFCIMAAFTTPYEFQTTILGETNQAGPGLHCAYVAQLDGFALGQLLDLPAATSSTANLVALNHSELGGALAARVAPRGRRKNTYWIELRHPSGWDQGIGQRSVTVHEVRPGSPLSYLRIGPRAKALREPGDQVVTPEGSLVFRLASVSGGGLSAEVSVEHRGSGSFVRVAPAAAVPGGDLHLLGQGMSDELSHTVRLANGSWPFPWGDVRAAVAPPDLASLGSVYGAVGRFGELHVLALDRAGTPWHTLRRADGSWPYGWGDVRAAALANGGQDPGPARSLSAASSPTGDLQVLQLSQTGRLWHTLRRVDGSWPFGWGDVLGTIPGVDGPAALREVACAIGRFDELHLLAADDQGGLSHTIRRADGSWLPWGDVRGTVTSNGGPDVVPAGGIACASSPTGDLQILAVDPQNGLWHTLRRVDGSWPFPWGDIQDAIRNAGNPDIGGTSRVTCALGRFDDLHVLALDAVGTLWHTIRSADGGWYAPWGDVEQVVPYTPSSLRAVVSPPLG